MKGMTPLERVNAVKRGQKPDRIPLNMGPTNEFVCHYYGISTEDYLGDVESCTECSVRFIEDFQVDSSVVAPGYILYGCGPEMGVRWEFVENHFPGFSDGPLRSEADLEKICVPVSPSGYFRHYLDVLRRVHESLGDRYNLVGHILAPLPRPVFCTGSRRPCWTPP